MKSAAQRYGLESHGPDGCVTLPRQSHLYGLIISGAVFESLARYTEHAVPTRDFLRAVLCNDLMDAVGRADSQHSQMIPDIARFIYNKMPSNAWGSKEKVDAWLAQPCSATGAHFLGFPKDGKE